MSSRPSVDITSAKGTIFFIDTANGLQQAYDLEIANPGPAALVEVSVDWGGRRHVCPATEASQGKSTMRVFVPDVREHVEMTFSAGGSSLTANHTPGRHWRVHLVQFAHHDLGYTDLITNVLREMATYLDDALRFCAETDGFPEDSQFRYTIEQGWSLLYWMEHRPQAMREEMMRRIREGRIEVNALIGNQTTELHGPEEMVRAMYPVFALRREYGIPVQSAEHNDIPGVSWGVAAALSGAGVRWFAPGLPDYFRWGENYHTFWDEDIMAPGCVPGAFWWEAPNGAKTLFWHHRDGAGGPIDVTLGYLPEHLEKLEEKGYPYDVLRQIIRGADRDNSKTRVEFAYSCRDWNSRWAYPRLIQSLNSRFFPELEERLGDIPTYRGELPGTDYSVAASCTAYPSSLNRVTHDSLLSAERFAAVASVVTDYDYPADKLDEAYRCTLLNDEHAWGLAYPLGPGQDACIAQHCEFAYRAAALAHDVLIKSVNEIADRISRTDDGYYVAVFNPFDRARTDVATALGHPTEPCSMPLKPDPTRRSDENETPVAFYAYHVGSRHLFSVPMELLTGGLEVIDVTTGRVVPSEVYELPNAQAPVPYAAYRYAASHHAPQERFEVRFLAEDVPPLGYRLYRFGRSDKPAQETGVIVRDNTLENRFYRLEIDPATGALRSIFDKDLQMELVDASAEHAVNQLVLRSSIDASVSGSQSVMIDKGRTGAVSGSLTVHAAAAGLPQITCEITLYSDLKRIDIANRVLKDSTSHLETFFAFPFALEPPRFRYEGTLSVIEPLVDQLPGSNSDYHCVQHWASVSDGSACVTLVAPDAPIVQFGGNWPLYVSQAHHGVTPPGFDHPFHGKDDVTHGHLYSLALLNNYRTNFTPTQCGDLLFRYSITSGAGDWRESRARDFGYGVSLPLVTAAVVDRCEGGLPSAAGYCSIDCENVLLLALKRAEDGRGFIVRVIETEGRDTTVRVTLPLLAIVQAMETNLVEEDLRLLPMTEHTVTLDVPAWGTTTVRLLA